MTRGAWRRLRALATFVALAGLLAHALAASNAVGHGRAAWPNPRFVYEANGKRLSEVLQDFAASERLPVVIAEGVDGVVHGSFKASPEAFLDAMARTYGLVWYHDGTALYVYPSKSMQSRLFRLKGFTREQVEQMLASLNLGDRRYTLRFNEREKTLLAYGPPRHIDLINAALESLDSGVMERNRVIVRVFPLRYASAADRVVGRTNVPGLVSVLRGTYGGALNGAADVKPSAQPSGAAALAAKTQAMQGLYGGGTTRLIPGMEGRPDGSGGGNTAEKSSTGVAPRGMKSPVDDEDPPWFEADETGNAVIIRGRLSRMAEYGYLIRRLDQRPMLVELEAVIIDVSSDSIDSLGIDWSARGRTGAISVSPQQVTPTNSVTGTKGGGFTIGTLWKNAGHELLARIDLLSSKGQARIVARPKVLGVANRPASMQEKRVAAVRVAGNLDAQLYQLEAGTLLQVTPQVTENDGTARMKLAIYIEDGNFESSTVDNVPIIKRTEIRTEAHVVEGESLLIGGITVEAQTNSNAGVPGLSRIPLLGGLFRSGGSSTARSERLFLITPKLVRDADHLPALKDNQVEGDDPGLPVLH